MPLKSGSSPSIISENIRELHHGPTHAKTARKFGEKDAHEQSIAIAMETARRTKRKKGGRVHVGPIIGTTGGRADKRPMEVPDGAYVLTADHVSGIGEGNTHAGMDRLNRMFPHSAKAHQEEPKEIKRASGGKVPIYAADGEYVIDPKDLVDRFGDVAEGHRQMDNWQMHERQHLIHTLTNLDPPAQD